MSDNFSIPIVNTHYVSKLAKDYLSGKEINTLNPGVPVLNQLIIKAAERKFSAEKRILLVDALLQQYEKDGIKLEKDSNVYKNILSLNDSHTFSFTTGQQIHIFLGPLFFLYKIQSLIGHVKNFNKNSDTFKSIPIFWMATEDHDLAEINYVKLYGETFTWETTAGNAVGRIACEGLPELIDKIEDRADKTQENTELFKLFKKHYLSHITLAAATRSLLHEIFNDEGLVIMDADDKVLKQSFANVALKDIEEKVVFNSVKEKNAILKKSGYEPRVNPQEINFFWLDSQKRIKLKIKDGQIQKEQTSEIISLEQIQKTPEKLSPNVLLRPIYQESILPNIMYLGGSAEVEYWLPLQDAFRLLNVQYPLLVQRDSELILSKKNLEVIEKAGFVWSQLFEDEKYLATIFFENSHEKSGKVSGIISELLSHLSELKTDFEKNESTPGSIHKELSELQKGVHRLSKNISDEELRIQKENVVLNRILKLKSKFFDLRQERDEFVVNYPGVIHNKIDKDGEMDAKLILKV